MKSLKLITAGLFLFGATALVQAQDKVDNTADRTFSWGVKGGLNIARVSGDDIPDQEARTSFHVGLVGELPLADIFSLQAEVLYSGQGFKYNYSGLLGDEDIEYQLDYINVPVLAKVYLFKGFSVEAGPQFGFKINEEIDSNPDGDDGDSDEDVAENFDFAVAGGITFQTEFGLFASGRYNYGLTDIVKDSDLRNSVFQISLGYKF